MTEALIQNGLTQAEVMQTGLQVFEDPMGHDAVVRFHGRYLDEIEAFAEKIHEFDQQTTYFAADEEQYKEASEKYSSYGSTNSKRENRFNQTIMEAIGQCMIASRQELYAARDAYLGAGDVVSRSMAEFLAARLPERLCVGINGQNYHFNEGFMVVRGSTSVIFGNAETIRQFATKHYGDKLSPRPAETKDWLSLFENLGKVSLF